LFRLLAWALLTMLVALAQSTFANHQQEKAHSEIVKPQDLSQTAFTYQGQLNQSGLPASGVFDFQFRMYGTSTGGEELTVAVREAVVVANGLFKVEVGSDGSLMNGRDLWLEIAVRPSGSADTFTVLSPRQKLTALPYAVFAQEAPWSLIGMAVGFAGDVENVQPVSGSTRTLPDVEPIQATGFKTTDSGRMTDRGTSVILEAAALTQITTFWGTTGNAGTNPTINFLGTMDNQALEFRANNIRRLRLEPNGSIAAGSRAKLNSAHTGAILFTDSQNFDFVSAAANEFAVRATGGFRFIAGLDREGNSLGTRSMVLMPTTGNVGIGTTTPASKLTVAGMIETTSGGLKFPDGTIQLTAGGGIAGVKAGAGLTGGGTTGMVTLGIANGGVDTTQLASNAVRASKIASSQVVKSLNGLKDDVTLQPGSNITMTPSGNTLTIAATGGAAGLTLPYSGSGSSAHPSALFSVTNTGSGAGVYSSGGGIGVFGEGLSGVGAGVVGKSSRGFGVYGESSSGWGVWGQSSSDWGVYGHSTSSFGVRGYSGNNYGVAGFGGNIGVYAHNNSAGHDAYLGAPCCAGDFYGNVAVHGNLTKTSGAFKIDHPLDPENKYLYHSFVESPDMMNIYNGNAVLDASGEAVVELPNWFEALNKDFRYQLTAIGAPGPNLYIAEEIHDNRFKIAGGVPGTKVSWQVTGVRKDAYAEQHRIPVEEAKPESERGTYLHPGVYRQSSEKAVQWARHPETLKQLKEAREKRPQ
jgi:hypothetical protein